MATDGSNVKATGRFLFRRRRKPVRHLSITILALLAMIGLTSSVAFASTSGAHFMPDTSASIDASGALVVSIDEAGVGNENVTYTLTADSTATYACINGGGNHPKAANKVNVNGGVTGGGTFSPTNGRIHGSVSAGPLTPNPATWSCPPGQTAVLANVSYSNIVLTDTTNGVSINLGSLSRTFFTV